MAGTSGCIPSHNVNFFGQLCGPRPSTSTSASEPESESNIENQLIEPPSPLHTPVHIAKPDRITELFAENQKLIRSYSPANIELFEATVKQTFAGVRRERAMVCMESAEGHLRVEGSQGGRIHDDQAASRNSHPVQPHNQCLDRNTNPPNPALDTTPHHYAELHHPRSPPPTPYQSPTHPCFIITPYSTLNSNSNSKTKVQDDKSLRQTPLQEGEIILLGVELRVEECERDEPEMLGMDALLLANSTGDPEGRVG